jgi:hypothetical protein
MEGDLPARAVLVEQIADDARRRWRGHLLDLSRRGDQPFPAPGTSDNRERG